ncbi:hypothetical protein PILCRDRAFT_86098 [Piloderma croceum F 1598]|uniref:Uncharacterized protein n=1 Tax=Piloderma croceum (strain F 1598) TaxID=765440 RepID=A0A0C3CB45_PILCF|nr:hypothetical protein PILCRDRAFT_86098 [Piloderma croceum F 1598]
MTTTMMSTTKGTRTSPNAAFSGISKYRLTRGSNGRGNGSPPSACGYEGHDLDILRRKENSSEDEEIPFLTLRDDFHSKWNNFSLPYLPLALKISSAMSILNMREDIPSLLKSQLNHQISPTSAYGDVPPMFPPQPSFRQIQLQSSTPINSRNNNRISTAASQTIAHLTLVSSLGLRWPADSFQAGGEASASEDTYSPPGTNRHQQPNPGIVLRLALLYSRSGSLFEPLFRSASEGKVAWYGTPGERYALIHADDVADLFVGVNEMAAIAGGKIMHAVSWFHSSITPSSRSLNNAI